MGDWILRSGKEPGGAHLALVFGPRRIVSSEPNTVSQDRPPVDGTRRPSRHGLPGEQGLPGSRPGEARGNPFFQGDYRKSGRLVSEVRCRRGKSCGPERPQEDVFPDHGFCSFGRRTTSPVKVSKRASSIISVFIFLYPRIPSISRYPHGKFRAASKGATVPAGSGR